MIKKFNFDHIALTIFTILSKDIKKIVLLLTITASLNATPGIRITTQQAQEIGKKIWQNECNGTIMGLTSWNDGEQFASLGIGHFIWYPTGKSGHFKESFPSLLTYMKSHSKKLPKWLETAKGAPWQTKQAFDTAKNSKRMIELRTFLQDTIDLQTKFMVDRLLKAFAQVEKKFPAKKATQVKKQFYRVAHSPNGLYALIDYVNFKGEGFNPQEAYNNQGWGLMQVLEHMHGTTLGKPALQEFADAAKTVLTQRVENAPKNRDESRWLKGWFNRIATYTA